MNPTVAAPTRRVMPGSGDLADRGDPGDAANQCGLADAVVAPIVPQEMQYVEELVIAEQPSHQMSQVYRPLGQGLVGEHRRVKVSRQLSHHADRPEVAREGTLGTAADDTGDERGPDHVGPL